MGSCYLGRKGNVILFSCYILSSNAHLRNVLLHHVFARFPPRNHHHHQPRLQRDRQHHHHHRRCHSTQITTTTTATAATPLEPPLTTPTNTTTAADITTITGFVCYNCTLWFCFMLYVSLGFHFNFFMNSLITL